MNEGSDNFYTEGGFIERGKLQKMAVSSKIFHFSRFHRGFHPNNVIQPDNVISHCMKPSRTHKGLRTNLLLKEKFRRKRTF